MVVAVAYIRATFIELKRGAASVQAHTTQLRAVPHVLARKGH